MDEMRRAVIGDEARRIAHARSNMQPPFSPVPL
jgi:hypothetical protein